MFSQKIGGLIQDSNGTLLTNVSVMVKDSLSKTIAFTFSDNNGEYSLSLNYEYSPLFIHIKKYGYQDQSIKIEKNKNQYHFVLEKINILDEVVIKGNPTSIRVKKDTTIYKIEKFTDGTEKKIEDVLKKLPGIVVSENGKIQFKGKEVEKVLIDGDDFFDTNYTLGTKNISANMLSEVQAIERYNDNQVLKNLEDSEKIALNLKLKKGESDWSKSLTIGLGYKDKYFYDLNILRMSYKLKSILTSTYNTIGINNSLFDTFNNFYFGNLKESEFTLPPNINLSFQNLDVNPDYLFQNNNSLNAINNILKLSDKSSLKFNFMHIQDKLNLNNNTVDYYSDESQNFIFNQYNEIIRKPKVYNFYANYLYSSEKLRVEIDMNDRCLYNKENIYNNKDGLEENNNLTFTENLQYVNSSISKKLNQKTALEILSMFSTYKNEENLYLENLREIENADVDIQNVTSQRNVVENRINIVSKIQNFKYKLGLFYYYDNQGISSVMKDETETYFHNNLKYGYNNFGLFSRWSLNTQKIYVSNENEIFINRNEFKNENLLFAPKIRFVYNINEKNQIEFNYKYNLDFIQINQRYKQYIFTSPFDIAYNNIEESFLDSHFINMSYSYNNFYKEYLIKLYTQIFINKKNLSASFTIDDNIYYNQYYLKNSPSEYVYFGIDYNKLYSKLYSRLKLTSLFSIAEYESTFFESAQNNNIKTLETKINYTSFFKGSINFSNENKFRYTNFNGLNTSGLNNKFSILYTKNKNHVLKLSSYFVIPQLNQSQNNYLLLNFEYFYTKNGHSFNFLVNNITNARKIYQIKLNENGYNYFSQDILPIGFIAKYEF